MLGRLFAKTDPKQAPEPRADAGESDPVGTIEIDGAAYPLASWSQSGFMARDYTGGRESRDKVEVTVSVTIGGKPFKFACTAMLVRVDRESRKLVGSFFHMDTSIRVELARRLGC